MGEKFAANPATGAGSMTVPVYTSAGRSGLDPQLSISYDSGSANGVFGFGWSLGLPSVSRKTDKGLPQYRDAEETDTFILAGAEDLVPVLTLENGVWVREELPLRSAHGGLYRIARYRPRTEGLFATIERWTNESDPSDSFWRTISKENVTAWYGRTAESRTADAEDPARIFAWQICESHDDRGNVVSYRYKPEDSDGLDGTELHEANRTAAGRAVNRYVKRILYGNRTPYFPDLSPLPSDWCFEVVFDYGEHDPLNPLPSDAGSWGLRGDPFSTYRSTFEIRTYRLCRRVLMFHHFPADPAVGADCLVRSTDLTHARPGQGADPWRPFYSHLLSVRQVGYRRSGGAYLSKSLPPIEFEYSEALIDETVREVGSETLANLPEGLGGSGHHWVDLDGEGVSGMLAEQGGAWYYKANLSPASQRNAGGLATTQARLGPVSPVERVPSLGGPQSGKQFLDLTGHGRLDVVQFEGPTPGFFERSPDEGWEPFTAFRSLPNLPWEDRNLRFVDLTGDGRADVLITEDEVLLWHESLASSGFGPAHRVAQSGDEERGPKLLFADGTETVFLADMSGDGLSDLVRVRNGEVCYWPNKGYGIFGAKVAMDQAPLFDHADRFDGRRVRLVDIDGSGTADIVYLAADGVHLYSNQSGNAWGERRTLDRFPTVDGVSSAQVVDLLGNGTACLVWSSPLPAHARSPLRYIDLVGGQKPHLLVGVVNNLGAQTRLVYAPSTKFSVRDKLMGRPWLTRLPFPVQVVERIEVVDLVNRNRFVTRHTYHHGYYDGAEREFRGFARVEQFDTEELVSLRDPMGSASPANVDDASYVPPVRTVTWFHAGAFQGGDVVSKELQKEYFRESQALSGPALEAMTLPDMVFPHDVRLPDGSRVAYEPTAEELREACRALRGSVLRQEVYATDKTDAAHRPYTVSERNYTLEILQPQGPNRFGVFFAHARETVDFSYERKLYKTSGALLADPSNSTAVDAADPRVAHSVTLDVDPFGNVERSVSVAYGRRFRDPALSPFEQQRQLSNLLTYTETRFTNAVSTADARRTPLPAESRTYELLPPPSDAAALGITNLFRIPELRKSIAQAGDGAHDVPYPNYDPAGLPAAEAYGRLIEQTRVRFRPDDLGAEAHDAEALLPLGKLEGRALPGESYRLAFTPDLLDQVYQRDGAPLVANASDLLEGGYVDLDGNGSWWIRSGRSYFDASAGPLGHELAEAAGHFFLPRRFVDPFGNAATVAYDANDLFPIQTVDPLGNVKSASIDYRVLQPSLVTDANRNRTAVSFDVLGMVAGAAVMGKATETVGDLLVGFDDDLTSAQIDAFFDADDPHGAAAGLLGGATTRVVYDVGRFAATRAASPNDPSKWEPARTATLSRETHLGAPGGGASRIQIAFGYSDGFGREIQRKTQAEPAAGGGPLRWVATGWTVFNNKGKPVRKFEPFFSGLPSKGHRFEFGVAVGVGAIVFYDPLGRPVATTHPNHTYEKVVFDPWSQTTWDVNDNVLQADPRNDPDAGAYFRRLPTAAFLPTWHAARVGGALGLDDKDAATKAAAHANTPAKAYLDPLGRAFLTVADNGGGGLIPTRVRLDVEGNEREVSDRLFSSGGPEWRIVMRYDYDLLSHRIHQSSMEAGERWSLNDGEGKPIRSWDSRGQEFRTVYDEARRPTELWLDGGAKPRMIGRTVYGESYPHPEDHNLREKTVQQFDQAGVVTTDAYDFKGNPRASSRRLAEAYRDPLDWAGPVDLENELFETATEYDALNRTTKTTTPDGSATRPTYNEANLLETVAVILAGTTTTFVANVDYDAKGRRTLVEYANGARTRYRYDPETFRLTRLVTTRPALVGVEVVQDLGYTYDPAGNVTRIRDAAQQTLFFRGAQVAPRNDYTYDAVYRLVEATGRERVLPTGAAPSDAFDASKFDPDLPGSGAIGNYTERYAYDAAGNILSMIHQGATGSLNWTRGFTYAATSQIEPGRFSNRLTKTAVGGVPELYRYDGPEGAHGNITQMPHLSSMAWNFQDQLCATATQATATDDPKTTYYVYDAGGQRVRKVTEGTGPSPTRRKERIYLGGVEYAREYGPDGKTPTLERRTLHVIDDKSRVALVEYLSLGGPTARLDRYQFGNHLGSVSLELDGNAKTISYEEYTPYGSTSYSASAKSLKATPKRYRYTGKERDEENGFTYHGARYYAPWLGRWTACDPMGIADGANAYLFVHASPIVLIDPTGEAANHPDAPDVETIEIIRFKGSRPAPPLSGPGSSSRGIYAQDYKTGDRLEAKYGTPGTKYDIDHVDPHALSRPGDPQTFRVRPSSKNRTEGVGTRMAVARNRQLPGWQDPNSEHFTRPTKPRGKSGADTKAPAPTLSPEGSPKAAPEPTPTPVEPKPTVATEPTNEPVKASPASTASKASSSETNKPSTSPRKARLTVAGIAEGAATIAGIALLADDLIQAKTWEERGEIAKGTFASAPEGIVLGSLGLGSVAIPLVAIEVTKRAMLRGWIPPSAQISIGQSVIQDVLGSSLNDSSILEKVALPSGIPIIGGWKPFAPNGTR